MSRTESVVGWYLLVTLSALGLACAPSSPAPAGAPPAPPRPEDPPAVAAPATPRPTPVGPTAAGTLEPARAVPAPIADVTFDRVLDVPVRGVALGKTSRVAALADVPYLFDGRSWLPLPLPAGERPGPGETDTVSIFFGRDDQPRLLGTRHTVNGSLRAVYLRYRPSGWVREPGELGPLARTPMGLYGILGHDDPEVVCAPGGSCLVKRVTGWARIDADPSPTAMFLTTAGVYKELGGHLWLLEGSQWSPIEQTAPSPLTSICHESATRLWATGGEPRRLFRRDAGGGAFHAEQAPIPEPRVVWCAPGGVLWIAGDAGVARRDARGWGVAPPSLGSMSVIAARGEAPIWFGGERGLFVGRRSGSEAD